VTNWYQESFDDNYLRLYASHDAQEARQTLRQLVALLRPALDQPVLDLGCGGGRHLCALQQMGFTRLVGLDLSDPMLSCAQTSICDLAAGETCDVSLIRADMRRIPFVNQFGMVLSLFTSFGYFQQEQENRAVLQGVSQALLPGGVFVLDVMNRDHVLQNFVPRDERQRGGRQVVSERHISPDGLRVEKRTTIGSSGEETQVYTESVRLYRRAELEGMLLESGFAPVVAYGSFTGEPFVALSPRLILVAYKDRDMHA
jgi:SAM-dependent methyltransferase